MNELRRSRKFAGERIEQMENEQTEAKQPGGRAQWAPTRRNFIVGVAATGAAIGLADWFGLVNLGGQANAEPRPIGSLQPADANGWRLPAGFTSTVLATTGQTVPGTGHVWHAWPDGGEVFPAADGGWDYVSNSELDGGNGGVGVLHFNSAGEIIGAETICSGTNRNCAGGGTPWGTWMSCEEVTRGRLFECDPTGQQPAVERLAMGRFFREAAVCDPNLEVVYQTEDRPDGALYRFVPDRWGDLSVGELQVLVDDGGDLVWRVVPDPQASGTATKDQVPGTVRLNGGEGAWLDDGKLLFTTKGNNRVYSYDPVASELNIIYDVSTSANPILTGVDNVTGLPSGGVIIAEDGGDMQLVALGRDGTTEALCQLTGVGGSELTGPCVDASGTRLYVSSQRSPGRTYVIEGPFSDLIMPATP